jgi:hypothetical protein
MVTKVKELMPSNHYTAEPSINSKVGNLLLPSLPFLAEYFNGWGNHHYHTHQDLLASISSNWKLMRP